MKKKISCFLIVIFLIVSSFNYERVEAYSGYNAVAAINYAAAHWNDGVGYCAEFVSRCVQAGGINIETYGTTLDCYEAIERATGIKGQDLRLDNNGYATQSLDGNILSKGDVVIQWCYTHKTRPHILICSGYDSSGIALFYAHNDALNNGRYRLNRNYAYEHNDNCNMGAKVIHLAGTVDNAPTGFLDSVEPYGPQQIRVTGWAYDPDSPSQSLTIHVYVGGELGEQGIEGYAIQTDVLREDVNNKFGISGKHGFDKVITVGKTGSQKVDLYAINAQPAVNYLRLGVKTVNIEEKKEEHVHKWKVLSRTEPSCIENGKIVYACNDKNSTWGEYGNWSGWSNTPVTSSESRQVETRQIEATYKTEYNYSKWTQYNSSTAGGWSGPSQGYWSGVYCGYYIERGWSTEKLNVYSWSDSIPLYGYSGNTWYNESSRQVVATNAYTQYRYRDRELISKGCGAKKEETINALGHKWNSGTITKSPTTLENGTITYKCERCGAQKTEVINKLSADSNQTGWKKIDGKWFYYLNNEKYSGGWKLIGNKWYYFTTSGEMKTGWLKDNNKWYYLSTDGSMAKGWKKINNTYYYFFDNGSMASNEWVDGYWLNRNGSWTYKSKASWKRNNNGWWFGDTSGWYAKNETIRINRKYYSFDSKGYLLD